MFNGRIRSLSTLAGLGLKVRVSVALTRPARGVRTTKTTLTLRAG